MTKRIISVLAALLCSLVLLAQAPTGGVKGTVVNRNGRVPVENARLVLLSGAAQVASARTADDGTFLIEGLADGMYTLVIDAPEFLSSQVQVTVNDGYVKNMFNLSITEAKSMSEIDEDNYAMLDLENSGYSDNPTILFGSNDVFENIVGYNFSSVRFRARGYSSESQDVYLAGVRLNDAITGYTPFSLWSGLNEAMRDKESVSGADMSTYGLGGYNGLTNIFGTASHMRKGLRMSALTNSALYRLRLMASYATGMQDNGWAFAVNISTRLGGNDWIDGVYYKSFGIYLAADKQIDAENMISFAFFSTPGQRGVQNSSTQEVYDLMGDNMYNSNWGYQNGKVRNARVRKTNEPVAFVKHDWKPSDRFEMSSTILARFGQNGYTALDWYDAQDPRPDYYRNLPSYYFGTNTYFGDPDNDYYLDDLNRNNPDKYIAAKNVWSYSSQYSNLTHVDWDRLYNVNRLQTSGRSKYIQENRHTDQRDLNLAVNFRTRPTDRFNLNYGAFARLNYSHYYKTVDDLLGGEYFVNVDNFAERDFASQTWKLQNDLDYYMEHHEAEKVGKDGKIGYDYAAQTRNVGGWFNGEYTFGPMSFTIGGKLSNDVYWREGFLRKGLFPGKRDNGLPFVIDGQVIEPTYESDGVTITTSKGKSPKYHFFTWALKGGATYVIGGSQRVSAHVGYFTDAPKFNQIFMSPRTRNSVVDGVTPQKTFSADLNWQYNAGGINARVSAYYTTINDQCKVMSAYDDRQNTFSNFAITNIDQRNMGIELGFKVPTYVVPGLSVQGVLALGEYIYTSTPYMTQTVDNSAEVIMRNAPLAYWKHTILNDLTVVQKHYVPSTPQTAASIGLSYNYNYWFIDLDAQYFDRAYLDMSPLYRTDYAVAGPDYNITDDEVIYMTTQERFSPAFLLNASVGKSWYIQRKYQLGFSLNAKNILNNKNVKTGGYEATRYVDNTMTKERYYRFDSKYFYMAGFNYMLNIYFRF